MEGGLRKHNVNKKRKEVVCKRRKIIKFVNIKEGSCLVEKQAAQATEYRGTKWEIAVLSCIAAETGQ